MSRPVGLPASQCVCRPVRNCHVRRSFTLPKNQKFQTMSSLFLKLFDQVVLLLWGHLLHKDSLQFGYKPGYSTTQCSWFVMETASFFIRRKTPVILTLLDCTMAFDKSRFDILFKKPLERNLPPVVLRVLIYVYQDQYTWVKGTQPWSEKI